MTVEEKIKDLNARFQVLYFNDYGLFVMTIPNLLQETVGLIEPILSVYPNLISFNSSNTHLGTIDRIGSELSDVQNKDHWVRERYLAGWKQQFLWVCDDFYHVCWRFNKNILDQII